MVCCLDFLGKPLPKPSGSRSRAPPEHPLLAQSKGGCAPAPSPSFAAASTYAGSVISEVTSSSGAEGAWRDPRVAARAQFVRDHVPFGGGAFGPKPGETRFGYSMPEDYLEPRSVQLWPFPADASLPEQGAELLDIAGALARAGVTEQTFDVDNKEHRLVVGRALMDAIEARFPGKRAIHLADTSRVSGAAVYGEATVRSTHSRKQRAAQHVFHVDKFLPGIAKLYGGSGPRFGAQVIVDSYWKLWEPDFTRFGVTKEQAVDYTVGAAPGMLNVWVSLTPGGIQQQPLAIADMRNILLDDSDLDCVSTHSIVFPGLQDTITVLRPRATEVARLLFQPKMRFGQAILFSTTHTPHSAVWLEGQPDACRCSAEIRLLLVDGA